MPILVKMPKWGLMMKAGTVTEWLRDEGDVVSAGDPLFVAETDKATNDVEAPAGGVLRRIVARAGTLVAVSGPVAVIAGRDETLTDDAVDAFLEAHAPTQAPTANLAARAAASRTPVVAARSDDGRVSASPAARKRARELAIDLATVDATGPGGRITSDDVERAAAAGSEPTVTEQTLVVGTDQRVHVIMAGPLSASPLVFLHGLAGSAATWQGVIGSFVDSHRVVAVDLPGHGQSDAPDPATADYSIDGLTRVVTETLRLLGLRQVTLVGHSLGGAIAITAALADPHLVGRLVLVDSIGLGDEINPAVGTLLDQPPSDAASRALLELFFHDRRLVLDGGVTDHVQALRRSGVHEATRAISTRLFSASRQRVTLDEPLRQLTQPVLVIWGADDGVVPVADARHAGRLITNVRVAIIPDSGHAPQVETPDLFTMILQQFLAGNGA
jgi:pimeloyl-ACP methyl ester carboxylesterase